MNWMLVAATMTDITALFDVREHRRIKYVTFYIAWHVFHSGTHNNFDAIVWNDFRFTLQIMHLFKKKAAEKLSTAIVYCPHVVICWMLHILHVIVQYMQHKISPSFNITAINCCVFILVMMWPSFWLSWCRSIWDVRCSWSHQAVTYICSPATPEQFVQLDNSRRQASKTIRSIFFLSFSWSFDMLSGWLLLLVFETIVWKKEYVPRKMQAMKTNAVGSWHHPA